MDRPYHIRALAAPPSSQPLATSSDALVRVLAREGGPQQTARASLASS